MAVSMPPLYAVSALGPYLADDLKVSRTAVGVPVIVAFAVAAVVSLSAGRLVDVVGPRRGLLWLATVAHQVEGAGGLTEPPQTAQGQSEREPAGDDPQARPGGTDQMVPSHSDTVECDLVLVRPPRGPATAGRSGSRVPWSAPAAGWARPARPRRP
ncbi:hypothetical protein O7632_22040 [Solwaraspora sp. WMMD406]|uniref:hypothetical protein n=1 Tax=Solwaraspora sp. WMMD406 TaxID=3016095 RepID=UPI0024169847|nr:hypothetical protein [Solwaraspora sp. WMMD406]MDG4766758.1 hypothetical protein [Solwaraspora sp. WMMD406]